MHDISPEILILKLNAKETGVEFAADHLPCRFRTQQNVLPSLRSTILMIKGVDGYQGAI